MPINTAIDAAGPSTTGSARNRILEEVAKTRFRLGQFENALRGIENAPNEKAVLRQLAIESVGQNSADQAVTILRRLTDLDPESAPLAGRLASSLLDNGNSDGALKIVQSVDMSFESDRSRHDFIAKLLEQDRFDDARKLMESLKDAELRDWTLLAFVKRYATLGRHTETEKVVDRFSSQEKQAWAFFEAGQCSPKPDEWLRRAGTIIEARDADETTAEAVAIQRRIVGKALWNAGEPEAARQLLESSEAALAIIKEPFRRFRAHCFLARVLQNIDELDSVRNYVDVSSLKAASFSPIQRSELLQWFAEASGIAVDWAHAVRAAAKETDETLRSRRIVDILRRFSYAAEKTSPTGDPDLDAVLLPGEEFEEHYYSPFTVNDCDC